MVNFPLGRIVHGRVMGKLRRAVHEILAKHFLVELFRLGDYSEEDYGVTISEMIRH